MSDTPLTQEERYQIHALLKAGHAQSEIAMILSHNTSTISREIRRNTGLRSYRPKQAQRLVMGRRQSRAQTRIHTATWSQVEKRRKQDWSPEQISLWRHQACRLSIRHEWLYQYVFQDKANGGNLHRHLHCQKQRRKRYGSYSRYSRRGRIIDRVSINERPAVVDSRARISDWALDTIIGKGHQQAIVSLTERKSRRTLLQKVKHKAAACASKTIINLLSAVSEQVHTLNFR